MLPEPKARGGAAFKGTCLRPDPGSGHPRDVISLSSSRRVARRAIFVLALANGVLLPTVSARVVAAQPKARVDSARIEEARKLMEEGQGLFGQKKYQEAATAFKRAFGIQPFSAFVFNEAVCYEKLGEYGRAIETFERFIAQDPTSPDLAKIKDRITKLRADWEASKSGSKITPAPDTAKDSDAFKSLLIVESSPDGAPAIVFERARPDAAPFSLQGGNDGWREVARTTTPLAATLPPGKYHVVIDAWEQYNRSDTDLDVVAGRVHYFKANLSQGAFTGFLRVAAPDAKVATIYLDDPSPHTKPAWGTTPRGEQVPKGTHKITIEAEGFEPYTTEVTLEPGDQKDVVAQMKRVGFGYIVVDSSQGDTEIFLDGKPAGKVGSESPLSLKTQAGKHKVRAEASGLKTIETEIDVPPGQAVDVHFGLLKKYPRGTAISSAVTSAAFLGGGIYLGLQSNKEFDSLKRDENLRTTKASEDDRVLRGKVFAYTADAAFGLAAIAGAFSVYEFIRDPLPPSRKTVDAPREFYDQRQRAPALASSAKPSIAFAPAFTPTTAGLFFQGKF